MKTKSIIQVTEGAIWGRIVDPNSGHLDRAAARELLELDFQPFDRKRMDELAAKAGAGTLSAEERREAETYNRVAHVLALLQSKARQSLRPEKAALMPRVPAALRNLVRRRANDACEYCQIPQEFYRSSFQPDHIIAEVHRGPTLLHNLCWSCFHCNLQKGTNLAGIDPKTRRRAWLFNPPPHEMGAALSLEWATVAVLKINDDDYVQARAELIAEGVFPRTDIV